MRSSTDPLNNNSRNSLKQARFERLCGTAHIDSTAEFTAYPDPGDTESGRWGYALHAVGAMMNLTPANQALFMIVV